MASKSIHARITVYPRAEALDPQGQAVAAALARVGFDQVREVRAGKSYQLVLEGVRVTAAKEMLQQMCERLLANAEVEDYSIECPWGAEE